MHVKPQIEFAFRAHPNISEAEVRNVTQVSVR